jgi:putative ABC transport system ATP-binding protein
MSSGKDVLDALGGAVPSAATGVDVRLAEVSKTYRTGAGLPVRALAEVTLGIPAGQTVAVTGRSGSGKSTLLHLAGAMDVPDSGTLTVGGQDLTAMSDPARTRYRRGIGFVFQRFHLLPALTACDNVAAPLIPFRTSFDKRAKATALLSAVGLEGREHDLPSKLSGGQQQRVAIARALIGDPRLLLADEPTRQPGLGHRCGGAGLAVQPPSGARPHPAAGDARPSARRALPACDRTSRRRDSQRPDAEHGRVRHARGQHDLARPGRATGRPQYCVQGIEL